MTTERLIKARRAARAARNNTLAARDEWCRLRKISYAAEIELVRAEDEAAGRTRPDWRSPDG